MTLDVPAQVSPSSPFAKGAPVPDHWMRAFFEAHCRLDNHESEAAYEAYSSLLCGFPKSNYLSAQVSASVSNFESSRGVVIGLA